MSFFRLLVEGLTQPPNMSSNLVSSFSLLFAVTVGPLPLVNEATIAVYLALHLAWCGLLRFRAHRVVGSRSVRRVFEAETHAAILTWLDVLRVAVLGWVAGHLFHFEVGVQMCELYCGVIVLRTLLKPLAYVVLRIYGGPAVATRFTGFDPSAFVKSMGTRKTMYAAGGPAWKQHGPINQKATSAAKRLSSLAPSKAGNDAKNNNDRCIVLDEGPHFNRTARGCLLAVDE